MYAVSIDRRDFLRRTAALGALPFVGFARSAVAAEADLIDRRVFFVQDHQNLLRHVLGRVLLQLRCRVADNPFAQTGEGLVAVH